MKVRRTVFAALATGIALGACSSGNPTATDGGNDAGADAGRDGGSSDGGTLDGGFDGGGTADDGGDAGFDAGGTPDDGGDGGFDGGRDGGTPDAGMDAGSDDGGLDGGGDAGAPDASVSTAPCSTTFRFVPEVGTLATTVTVLGDWDSFDAGVPMVGPDPSGAFTAAVQLAPGFYAYQFTVDGQRQLDPAEKWQKYVAGAVNSGLPVTNCHLPSLALASNATARPTAGQGEYTATIRFVPGEGAPSLDPASIVATLRKDGQSTPISGVVIDAALSSISLDVPHLGDGKYTAFVTAQDVAMQSTQTLRLVFWVEAAPLEWSDTLVYAAVTDRFVDGDPTNDPPPTTTGPGGAAVTVDPREDYHGGDYAGLAQEIDAGVLDQLAVNTLWMSPPYTGPSDAWPAADNVHYLTGYAGNWPIRAREVDARLGGTAALQTLVAVAHAHGIRVLMDLAIQSVHQEHEYLTTNPEWFNTTGCICGANSCDPIVHRLDCLTASYLPNIDWTSTAGAQQWEADAIWWLDTFDFDGLHLAGVEKVPDAAVLNLSSAVSEEFEASGTPVYRLGTTAAGWVDNTLSDNLSEYQLVSAYLADGLQGQLDEILYYAVPPNVFANQSYGMDHADYWVRASGWEYPAVALMSPYVGSQETARFITLASYRGQTPALDPSIPYNQWTDVAGPPPDSETYGRHRLALAWLLGLPGVPMLYYGDEYGEYGGVDPNNRVSWRGDSMSLSADEQATLAFVQRVGQARKNLTAMRRGAYVPVYNTDANVLVFARQDGAGDVALEALSRLDTPTNVTTALPASLSILDGTMLHDQLGGPDVSVSGGLITIALSAQGAAILAP